MRDISLSKNQSHVNGFYFLYYLKQLLDNDKIGS
jgi:hypothetical protein